MLQIPDSAIAAAARAVRRDASADVGPWTVEAVPYAIASPTTAGLFRVTGGDWSLFAKIIQSFRHWPLIEVFPPDLRRRAIEGDGWRYEIDLYRSPAHRLMPPGMRLPAIHGIVELGDDRVAVLMEAVVTDDSAWDIGRFARAAHLLGRLNVRMTGSSVVPPPVFDEPAGPPSLFYRSRLLPVALPLLDDDTIWAHPLMGGRHGRGLRADLVELARRIPAMLEVLAALPRLRSHGDACPANLLVPVAEPDLLVAIDWSMGATAAVGDDLGQLLVGPAHDGALAARDLPAVRDTIIRSYAAGLADEGLVVDHDIIRYGMDAGAVVRSAFTALPFDRLGEPITDELAQLVHQRLALTRYLVDLGLFLPAEPRRRRPNAA